MYQSWYLNFTRPEVQSTTGLARERLQQGTRGYVSIITCLIMITLSAALYSRSGKALWRVIPWAATAFLLGLVILGAAS
jgi:hypothetical protein